MPQEHKKRGRREQNKRKRDDFEANASTDGLQSQDFHPQFVQEQVHDGRETSGPPIAVFYGLLDEQEQIYFKDVDSLLENNQFETESDRDIFLTNVYKEADGKELKLACSQSCSRVMERLIMLSRPLQTVDICEKLKPHLFDLSQHRFASHCTETLLSHVARTLATPGQLEGTDTSAESSLESALEDFVLSTADTFKAHVGFLMSDPFGSHVLRLLLTILSEQSWCQEDRKPLLQSKRREGISVNGFQKSNVKPQQEGSLPPSFGSKALELSRIIVASLDTTNARALATHPRANPVLQVLLELELGHSARSSSDNSLGLFHLLFPVQGMPDAESLAFVNHLLYDTIGSRLLEVVIEKAPRKHFIHFFQDLFEPQLSTMARSSIASFVLVKTLVRLRAAELKIVLSKVQNDCQAIIDNGQTQIITVLVEQCRSKSVDLSEVTNMLRKSLLSQEGSSLLQSISQKAPTSIKENVSETTHERGNDNVHRSLLFQTMLAQPDSLRSIVNDSLMDLPHPDLIDLCKDRAGSRVVQAALTVEQQDTAFQRRFLQRFPACIVELSLDPIASHVVDALFDGTRAFNFLRERMATELVKNEASLRDSIYGHIVWRNWKIDLFKRHPRAWLNEQKTSENERPKTKLELARDNHANTSRPVNPRKAKG